MYCDRDALLLWQYFIIYNHRNGFLIQGDFALSQSSKQVAFDIADFKNRAEQDDVSLHAQVLVEATYNGLTEEMSEILMGSNNANLGPIQEFIRETRKINQYRRLIEDTNQIELDQSAAVADQYRKYPYPTWRTLVVKARNPF